MVRILLSFVAALAACTPSPQETDMRKPGPNSATTGQTAADPEPNGTRAAQGPTPEPSPVTENPVPGQPADSPAAALGRRTLSTAFVRLGAGEPLTVELRDGRVLVLRDVVMRRDDYCGVQVSGGPAGVRFCGGYAEVAAARPGGTPSSD